MLTNVNFKLTQVHRTIMLRINAFIGQKMPPHEELISRLGSLRRTVINIKEITGLMGLQTQVTLLEDDRHEVRSQWTALAWELSHMSFLADNVLNKVNRAKVRKRRIGVGDASLGSDVSPKLEAKTKRGSI